MDELFIEDTTEDTTIEGQELGAIDEQFIPEFMSPVNISNGTINRQAAAAALAEMRYGETGETFQEIYNRAKVTIENGGEEALRSDISDKKSARSIEVSAREAPDLYDSFEKVGKAMGINKYALEEAAVDQLVDMGLADETYQSVSIQEDFESEVRDMNVKMEILQGELAKIQDEFEGQPFLKKVGNFLASFLPLNQTVRDLQGFAFDSGSALNQRRSDLLSLPIEEFKQEITEYVDWLRSDGLVLGNNPLLNQQAISNLIDFSASQTSGHTFWTLFDVADIALLGTAGSVKGGSMLLRRADAVSENPVRGVMHTNATFATDTAVGRILNAQQGVDDIDSPVTTLDSLDVMLPTYASKTLDPSVGISGDALRSLEANQRALASVLQMSNTNKRLTPEELTQAYEDTRQSFLTRYKPTEIKDIHRHGFDEVTGMNRMSVVFGKANGTGGFATERSAKKSADRRGLSNFDVIKNTDGQFYIRQVHNILEEGYKRPYSVDSIKDYGFKSQVVNPHSFITKELSVDAMMADGRKTVLMKAINENIVAPLSKLSGGQRDDLNLVLAKGMEETWTDANGAVREGKWFTQAELNVNYQRAFGRFPSDKEVQGYYAMKNLNDFDYVLRNNAIYTTKARQGYEDVEIGRLGYTGAGKIITKYDSAASERILNVTDDMYYNRGEMTPEKLKELTDNGYSLIRLENPVMRPSGKDDIPVYLALVKRGDFKSGPLSRIQLSYREGGHRMYSPNQKFAKQAYVGETPEGGKFLMDPIVHAAGESTQQLQSFVNRMEEARNAVLEYKAALAVGGDLTALEGRMVDALENANIQGLEHWDELVANRTIRENTPFEITADGKDPLFGQGEAASYQDLRNKDLPMDDLSRWVSHQNRPYTGKRGERLVGPDDELVSVMDPLDTADRAINNAINTGAYYDYRTKQIESWVASSRPYLQNPIGDSFSQVFDNPVWNKNIDEKFQVKLEAQRAVIQRQLSMRTKSDIAWDYRKQATADWIEGKTGISQAKIRDKLDVFSNDSVQRVRSLAYDLYLGLLNPAQALLQTQTTAAILSLSPRMGGKAAAGYTAMRVAWNSSDDFIDNLGRTHKALIGMGGMEPQEFSTMMKELKRSGFGNINEGFSLIGDINPTSSSGGSIDKVRRVGRTILTEAERINSGVAWGTAWREFGEQFPKVSKTSDEARRWILDRANALNMDMRHHAKSALQEGVTAIPAQFAQYQLHLLQNMLGRNTRFTRAEQQRLVIGQVFLYGGAALPFGEDMAEYVASQYQEATGEQMSPEVYKQITSGLFDTLAYVISDGELDTDFGSRAGVGGWVDHMVELWTNHTPLEVIGGAGSPAFIGLADRIWRNGKFIADSVLHQNLTATDVSVALRDIARSASGFSAAERAYFMNTTGIDLAKSGAFQGNEKNELEAAATILGVPLSNIGDTFYMYGNKKDRDERIESVAKMIVENNNRVMVERTSNPDIEASYAKRNAVLLKALPDDLMRQDVLKEVAKRTPTDFYMRMVGETLRVNPDSPIANQPRLKRERQVEDESTPVQEEQQ